MGHLFPGDFLPQHLAVVAIKAKQGELLDFGRSCAATASTATARPTASELRARLGLIQTILVGFAFLSCWDGRLNENLLFPNDRRGGTFTRNSYLPFNVVGLVPV